jgi:hypothetical protein
LKSDAGDGWPEPISLLELLTEPANDELRADLIDGLLPSGGTSLLVGKPKVGKSTVGRSMLYSAATGTQFCGRGVQRGLGALLAFEDHRAQLRDAMRAMNFAGDEQVLIFAGAAPADPLAWLHHLVRTHRPALLIVDTLNRLLRIADLNDYSVVDRAIAPITDLARESGTHILLVHHASKSKRGADVDAVLGSSAIAAAVDSVLVLDRRGDTRTLRCSSHRYGTGLPETTIAIDPRTGRINAAEAPVDRQRDIIERILELLSGHETLTQSEIRESIRGDHGRITPAIRAAVSDGRIKRSGSGGKGDPYLYSKIHADRPPTRINEQSEHMESERRP